MCIELEQYLDRVYRMADSIGEGLLSVNKWPSSINEGSSSSTRFVYLMLWSSKLCLISRGRGVFTVIRCLRVSVGSAVIHWWRIKWTKEHHCFTAIESERISWGVSRSNGLGNRSYFARPFVRNLTSIRIVSHVSSAKHKTRNWLFCTMPYSRVL